MRTLFLRLALLDCWEASWRLAAGDTAGAARYVVNAGSNLQHRARTRDAKDAWRTILGANVRR